MAKYILLSVEDARWLAGAVDGSNPGEVVLDCTAGSGTTGEAALREGRSAILIDDKADCIATMRQRLPTAKLRT